MTEQSEPTPTPLSELFARDPLKLSDQDIVSIVEQLRKQRKRFVHGDKSAGSPRPTKAKIAQDKAVAVTGKIDLSDLM